MEQQVISPAEWQVMRVLWAYPHSRSREVIQKLEKEMDWKPATIKTLLNRLKSKNLLMMEKVDGKFYYAPLISEEEHLENSWKMLLANMCNTKHGSLFLSILEECSLTQKDIAKMLHLLQKKQQSAPLTLTCHCPSGQCSCGEYCDRDKRGEK